LDNDENIEIAPRFLVPTTVVVVGLSNEAEKNAAVADAVGWRYRPRRDKLPNIVMDQNDKENRF